MALQVRKVRKASRVFKASREILGSTAQLGNRDRKGYPV
jgi:hypothetical protein